MLRSRSDDLLSDKSGTTCGSLPYSLRLFKFDLEWVLYLATSEPSGMFIF